MKKKFSIPVGLPVSFLDALGLALAAMILLMFTNLSALQSKEPPPERYHLLAKVCFSEVDLGRILWNLRWKYRSSVIFSTRLEADLSRTITFGKETPFSESRLFSKPMDRKMKIGESLLHFYGMAEIREHESQSILCYSLALAFPVDEEPSLEFEIERAGKLPSNVEDSELQNNDPYCWKKAVLREESTDVGKLLSRVYPLPYAIDATAYTTGAKSEFSFYSKSWSVPKEGLNCRLKKIRYLIRLADEKLELKETEVK